MYHIGGLGAGRWQFFVIFLKKSYFTVISITFRKFLESFEITIFFRFEGQLNKFKIGVFPLLTDQVQNTFKILNLEIKFCK